MGAFFIMSSYKDTIFLPKTDFQMNVKSPAHEEKILQKWKDDNIYQKILDKLPNDETAFVLHDGPPFANGHPHAGTALNRVLKDILIRLYHKRGRYACFVPGWDCHGLPIEWKIEENLKKEKKNKNDISIIDFRKMCMDFAFHWIEVQKNGFMRLGSLGSWNDPYLTMDKKNEAVIASAIGDFVLNDALYNADRPVHWSVIEETALADAEIEYHNKISSSIYVAFKVKSTNIDDFSDAYFVIWTTTPWTLPGNRAISYKLDAEYLLVLLDGRKFVVASDLLSNFCAKIPHTKFEKIRSITDTSEFKNTICSHPFSDLGFDFDVVLLGGNHVTLDAGTGLVHTAPSHGVEDFNICKEHGILMQCPVAGNGVYINSVPYFAGKHIFKIDSEIIELLENRSVLLHCEKLTHSYPHSWRSKSPLIFRTTPQWFINVEKIRQKALCEIEKINWIPSQGYNRIKSFIENRGDWCISRQRFWGVPLAIIVNKNTGKLLQDREIINRISEVFAQEGSDAWYNRDIEYFLCNKYNANEYEKCMDVLDVWFESAVSHLYVLEQRENLKWPADLYLEGSDQHRGWFQHSLLTAVECRGAAPFKSVLTHGFVVDENGRKMSKSLGNTVNLAEILEKFGADIFRLWVVSSDYTQDLKIGPSIIKQQEEIYKKIRNILKYLLGALKDFDENTDIAYEKLPKLERWILYKIFNINVELQKSIDCYDLKKYFSTILNFCFNDLSAFFFDIRKDCLYCDDENDFKRTSYRLILNVVFHYLLRWIAPVVVYTAEEAWLKRYNAGSVHLQNFLEPDPLWNDSELNIWIEKIKNLRKVVTNELELDRKNKVIGSSLQAKVLILDEGGALAGEDERFLEEVFIVSGVKIFKDEKEAVAGGFELDEKDAVGGESADDEVMIKTVLAKGKKCERCWKFFGDTADKDSGKIDSVEVAGADEICPRCALVIAGRKAQG